MTRNPETLALAMDYSAVMERCAAYCEVTRPAIREPQQAADILRPLAASLRQEIFWVLPLDTKNRLIGVPVEATRGLLDSAPVHPREVFRVAVRESAASVILAHHHPSGDPTPSKEDLDITKRLVEAGRILGICVVDHLIIGRRSNTSAEDFISLRGKGLVNF